jgi:hypothetical protein
MCLSETAARSGIEGETNVRREEATIGRKDWMRGEVVEEVELVSRLAIRAAIMMRGVGMGWLV